jgi:hypothetical protein
MSIYEYLAENKQNEVIDLLSKFGMPRPTSVDDAIYKLQTVALNYREAFFKEVAEIHPDKDLILHFLQTPQEEVIETEVKSNCDGGSCSCASCQAKSNMDAQQKTVQEAATDFNTAMAKYLPTIGLAILATQFYIIWTLKKN